MLHRDELNKLTSATLETSEHELGCDECLDEVDRFVEMELAGLDAAAAMPLVQDHLQKCGDCREEFEALLAALNSADEPHGGAALREVKRLWRRARRAFE